MASITWDDVVDHAPDLACLDVEATVDILAHVNTALVVGEFGGEEAPKLKLARIYLAAHYGTVNKRGDGAQGPVISERAGPLSRTYANGDEASSSESEFGATSYGRAYLSLLRTTPARAPIVI